MQPMVNNTEFHMTNWPLHFTLADVFAADFDNTDLLKKIGELVAQTNVFQIKPIEDTKLGSSENPVAVTLIEKSDELVSFHYQLVDLLEANGVVFNTPEFTKEGFLPHSTIQDKVRLNIGEQITIKTVSLIDMFPGGDWQQRKVTATFNLK
jgi:2'-5' RNA ligase